MYEWKLFREYPQATSRFLLALVEALRLSRLDSLAAEPGLANVRSEVQLFVDRLGDGESIGRCLETWLGRWSDLGELSAEHGAVSEWLDATAWAIATRNVFHGYLPVCVCVMLEAGVPLNRALPRIVGIIGDEDGEKDAASALESGAAMADIVEGWNVYSEPLAAWLRSAEARGEIMHFHEQLREFLVERELIWPVGEDSGVPGVLVSTMLMICLGLRLGRALDEIMRDLPESIDGTPWWKEFMTAYSDTESLARAHESAGVLTPLACAVIEQAELAGSLDDCLLACVERIQEGLLYRLPSLPASQLFAAFEPKAGGTESEQDEVDALEQWVEGISIRGRMAYALLCIEAACEEWKVESDAIRSALNALWAFTSSRAFDQWERRAQGAVPALYAFYDDFVDKQQWRNFSSAWNVEGIEDSQAEALACMLVLAEGIGSSNLYAGYESHVTAEPLKKIIDLMRVSGLELPNRSRVSLSRAEEYHGWGDPHPPEYFR